MHTRNAVPCRILRSFFLLLALWTAGGCRHDDIIEPSEQVPQAFFDLLDAAESGRRFSGIARTGEQTTITFTDGGTLSVPLDELFIYNCTESSPAALTTQSTTHTWKVGQRETGIRVVPEDTDIRKCIPVYVYYTYSSLCLCLNSGRQITLRGKAQPGQGRLPVVHITTDGKRAISDKETYVPATIVFDDPDELYSDVTSLSFRMGIRGRGNTSWNMPKKSWRIKLDEKSPVFGLHQDKDWDLLANYSDKTLLRNITAMELSRIVGMPWTPDMRSVEVYLNDAYQGVYVFAEHKEVSGHKVDIQVVTPEDNDGEAVTGGYYIEIDGSQDEPFSFWTGVGIPIMVKDPEEPTAAQKAYIRKLFSDFETTLYSDSFADPVQGYRAWIDVDSFIGFYIVQELTKNVDGNLRKSSFLSKERSGKLVMCHVWDFDIALGNCNYFNTTWPGVTNTYEGWFIRDYIGKGRSDGWYGRLFKDPAFVDKLQRRWNELMPQLQAIPSYIDGQAALLGSAVTRNFLTWDILGRAVWPNVAVFGSYQGELDYLKDFYTSRLEWLDREINAL